MNKLFNGIRKGVSVIIFKLLEAVYAEESLPPSIVEHNKIKKVLVIRQHDQLGDFLLSIPVYRALREKYPDAEISVLVREYFAGVARLIPYIDNVIVFYGSLIHWRWKNFRLFLFELRNKWDLTIVLNTVSHSLTSDILARMTKAKYILGSAGRVFPGCKKNFFYSLISPFEKSFKHQSEINLDIVRYIGIDTEDLSEEITISDAEKQSVEIELNTMGFKNNRFSIGLHIGAGKMLNRWPVKYFVELANQFVEKHNSQIILFWGYNEEGLQREFSDLAAFGTIPVGSTKLSRLAAFFPRCDAVVCNDTGIMHLAAATGSKVIAIFGPTDPDEWKPLNPNCIAVRAESNNVEDVGVSAVLNELERLAGVGIG